VDSSGNVYMTENDKETIKKYDSAGTLVTQWGSPGGGDGQFATLIATAVDSTGNVYVADPGNNRIQKFDSSGNYLMQWGQAAGVFGYPVDLAVDGSGNVYVVDDYNKIVKFDSSGNYITQWGSYGSGNGQFESPSAIDVDGNGNVYVLDGLNRIQKFDSSGNYLSQWGSYGSDAGQFSSPSDVAVDGGGNVYVVDRGNSRIQKFDSSGNYLSQWGSFGSGAGEFQSATGVAVEKTGNGKVYVTDTGNRRIERFDNTGNYLGQWGSSGSGNGQFARPVGSALDATGNIYVADSGNNRIEKFDSSGGYLAQWGTTGSGDSRFQNPTGVAADGAGNVYVVDNGNNRVQKFSSSGGYLTQWGSYGTDNGQFSGPFGIAVDGSGNVYVTDQVNQRVQKFDSFGTYLTQWGGQGYGNGQFYDPYGIAVDGNGNVYVADCNNHRVQKFDSTGAYLGQWYGGFGFPIGVAVDGYGNVYVTHVWDTAVTVSDGTGTFLGTVGTSGFGIGDGEFDTPIGISTNASGTLVYVSDSGNNRIQAFTGYGGTFVLTYLSGANGSINGTNRDIVLSGSSGSEVTAVPNAGFHFVNWTGTNGFVTTTQNPLTVTNVTASHTITANFALDDNTYTLSFFSGSGGFLSYDEWNYLNSPVAQYVAYDGKSTAIYAIPDGAHHFVNWTGTNGFGPTTANPLTVDKVKKSQTITANFAINEYAIDFVAGPNGSITGKTHQTVPYLGSASSVTAVPKAGYMFVEWTGTNGFWATAENPLSVTWVSSSQTITANFAPAPAPTYTLNFAAGPGGGVSGTIPQYVIPGESSTPVTALANAGYHFVKWTGSNGFSSTANPLMLTNVVSNQNFTANFAINQYAVAFIAGDHGSVAGKTNQTVDYGGSTNSVTAVADAGYHFTNWTDENDQVVGTTAKLILTNVTAGHVITAHFAR